MTDSGSSIQEKLDEIVSGIKREYNTLNGQVDSYETKITALNSERQASFVKLAKTYLTELEADDIERSLEEGKRDLERVLGEKQARKETLVSQMEDSDATKKQLEAKLAKLTTDLNAQSKNMDVLSSKISDELKKDPTYEGRAKKAAALRTQIEADKVTLESTTSEFKQKADAIMQNRFFRYLLNRNYDPEKPRFLDGWVAAAVAYDDGKTRYVGFVEVKKAFDYITKMPELMRADIEKREAEAQKLEKDVFAAEDAVKDKYGLDAAQKKLEEGIAARDRLLAQIKGETQNHNSYDAELRSLENKNDRYYDKAIDKLTQILGGQSIAALKEKARKTKGTEDDNLVLRIEQIDAEIITLQTESKSVKAKAGKVSKAYTEMKDLLDDFDTEDYEVDRSYFPEDFGTDLDKKVKAYLKSTYADPGDNVPTVTKQDVWEYIKENQNFRPRQTYSSYTPSSPTYRPSSTPSYRPSSTPSYRPSPSISRPSFGGFGGGSRIGGGGFGGGSRIGGRGF